MMESTKATRAWGEREREMGGLCLPEGKGPAGQASLGMSTPFQIP